ncbi:MAG: ATP-binding cassette domain-containing protein, partial [Proteobacteria bacterium]|nr:ATP-binding cassette domain-containing protein [Pseudomonadota bacterium]
MVNDLKPTLLSIRNLTSRFGSHRVLSGLDLEVQKGELLVLFGGSGSGKSTLLRAIIGLDPIEGGSILLNDQELTQLTLLGWRKVRQTIGYAFQSGALFDSLSVAENL